jgi:hypothetical protein
MPVGVYFRAPDRVAVELFMRADTISPIGREPGCDGIRLKHIDHVVLLGKLVAAITGAQWAVDLTGSVTIIPPPDTRPVDRDGWANLPEDSPWATGPWVGEIGDRTRDVLASLDPDQIPSVAATWAAAEEISWFMDQETAGHIIDDLRTLAQRAVHADEHLYSWASL